jgi:hypothetical protein
MMNIEKHEDPIFPQRLPVNQANAPAGVPSLEQVVRDPDGGREPGRRIHLATPVPVIWTYLTAWTTSDGITHFRSDIYSAST